MQGYNIIFRVPKQSIPVGDGLVNFLEENVMRGAYVDYFGYEIDNDSDYVDDYLEQELNAYTYLTFHFDAENEVSQDDAIKMVKEALYNGKVNISVHQNGKDVTILLT